jgi:hypothetical protein
MGVREMQGGWPRGRVAAGSGGGKNSVCFVRHGQFRRILPPVLPGEQPHIGLLCTIGATLDGAVVTSSSARKSVADAYPASPAAVKDGYSARTLPSTESVAGCTKEEVGTCTVSDGSSGGSMPPT